MSALNKALRESFDAHEEHRLSVSESRKSAKKARDADERVRHLRRLERERVATRAASSTRRGRSS